ncbi:hypothetical protein MAM1_0315d09579 [Mucor ambiguus]|uniref:Uncharacterized protein n=1 Tax=Mucor ambiguus TaxID=91626 RepID=A0A0C9LXG3_9FUNG|nr:hypothetical protein MAM1_0315d09579 [Mucor ambiguus]
MKGRTTSSSSRQAQASTSQPSTLASNQSLQQPQQSASSSTTQQKVQSGSGTATTISTASEPDYLGLYEMYDLPATEKPCLLSRMSAAGTSGFVGAEATGEIETGDDTWMAKTCAYKDTQSTASIRQTKKKSKLF